MDTALITLSIIIPIYNVENYLLDCFDSLTPLLENPKVQIILVNDGSTDKSSDLSLDFANKHVNVFYLTKLNGGLSEARNVGMEYAVGEYIFFLDSDDRIDGKNLVSALSFAKENELDWVQCGYVYDYGDYLLAHKHIGSLSLMNRDQVMDCLVRDGIIKNFAWGKLYRSNIVQKVEFPKGKYFEDSYWQYQIIHQSNRFGFFPDRVTYYRSRNNSISGNFSSRNLDLIHGLMFRLDFIEKNYPQLASTAAFKLWDTATKFELIAQEIEELRDIYSSASLEIRNKYYDLIKRGIQEQKGLNRFTNEAKFCHHKLRHKIGELLLKIYDRIFLAKFEIIRLRK